MKAALFILSLFVLSALDVYAYALAKYPERAKLRYKFPGGGFVALLRFGTDDDPPLQSLLKEKKARQ